jgi:hypothetical protein
MGMHSKRKGKSGEREVRDLFRKAFAGVVEDTDVIRRNHQQAEIGGADLVGVPHFSVEVKRVKQIPWGVGLYGWWAQCVKQADEEDKYPCLVFRQDHGKWLVMIEAKPKVFEDLRWDYTPMIMPWEGFAWYLSTLE